MNERWVHRVGGYEVRPCPAFNEVWETFRRRPVVVQAVAWLVARPILAALKILAPLSLTDPASWWAFSWGSWASLIG